MLDDNTITDAQKTRVSRNLKAARNLARHGFKVFPCNPKTKQPMPGVRWREEATDDLQRIAAWWQQWPSAMPGLPTGSANGVSVIDLDVRPDKDGLAAYGDLGLDTAEAGLTVATPSGGGHLYFDHRNGVGNRTTKAGIDVRGDGGYVIAPGAVGKAGAYRVERGDLGVCKMIGFGTFPIAMMGPDREPAADQTAPGGVEIDTLRSALAVIPNDGPHDDWTRILMALHHATAGSAHGRALAHGWSAGYAGYDPKEVDAKWRSFGKRTDNLVTVETLFAEARAHGWKSFTDDDLDDLPDDSADDVVEGNESTVATVDGLTFLRPSDCSAASRPYLVKGFLGQRDVACVVGAPGVGKSVFAPDLAYAVAQGHEFHGRRVKAGRVFYVAAEDHHGMQARLTALRDQYGDADDLRLVGGVSDLLNTDKGKKWSPHMLALARAVKAEKPALVVIDTLAMAFPGLEENSAEGMGCVMAVARKLTQWGAAVVLIHHDTKDGSNGLPRGHSLLNGALDVSLHLTRSPDGIVSGRLTKNRNGGTDLQLAFRNRVVEIGTDEDGDSITAAIADPVAPGSNKKEDRLPKAQNAALGHLLDLMGDDRPWVSEDEWRKACVNDRKVNASELDNTRRAAFRRAARDLCDAGRVTFKDGFYGLPDPGAGQLDDIED